MIRNKCKSIDRFTALTIRGLSHEASSCITYQDSDDLEG